MENLSTYKALPIYASYLRSPYSSIKHSSYFVTYHELFEQYRNKPITFVEVGVLNGGSLFMWRDYLGDQARIIGIDFNPEAKKWESHGFEIFIGNQADPAFWSQLYATIGNVDVLLDDGGHTYEQQIVTAVSSLACIKDDGLLVVEDTHTSYFKKFGYPSRHTFMQWCKNVIDAINTRSPKVRLFESKYKDFVYSVTFFESIVAFKINPRKCFTSEETSNNGQKNGAKDYRNNGTSYQTLKSRVKQLTKKYPTLHKFGVFFPIKEIYLPIKLKLANLRSIRRARKYFE